MSNNTNLKTQNNKFLWIFISFNVILLMAFFFAEYFDSLISNYKSLINIRLGSVLIAPLIVFILNGLLGSNQKAYLVFWKIKDVLPGCRAFSLYAKKDYRIDVKKLEEKYKELPINAKEQNLLWYKIFKTHESNIVVFKNHKDFLLARDLTSLSFLFLIFSGIPFLFVAKLPYNWIYFLLLITQYIILMIVARNHGARFVVNVLAIETTI